MKKLCVFTLYADKGASSQFRTYIYKAELEKDFDVRWFYFWNNRYVSKYMTDKKKYIVPIILQYFKATIKRVFQLLFIAPKCDVVYIQKACFPKLKILLLKHLKKKVKLVFDVDDAIFLSKGDNSDRIAAICDTVICGNITLKKHYENVNKNCIVLPTIENTHEYEVFWSDTFNEKIIGWIGSKATLDNLDLVIDPINRIVEKHPEVKFCVISNEIGRYRGMINNVEFIKWSKDNYKKVMSKFTIGIMPLKDTEYNRGKCGFKLIQYLNMRKPVIGSPVGVNKEIIEGNGICAEDSEQWKNAIEEMLYNEDCYNGFIHNIDNKFLEKYHFDSAYRKLKTVLED